MKTPSAIQFVAPQKAELVATQPLKTPPPGHVNARTLVSLTSPGTELNWGYLSQDGFPKSTGYAAIVEVEQVGSETSGVAAGDRFFTSTNHCSHVTVDVNLCTRLPDRLKAETAVFARLMGVSMSTLVTTSARPPGRVLITGLGPIGHLAAQVFHAAGYRTEGFDLLPARKKELQKKGIAVVDQIPEGEIYDLVVECSGHEQALLQAAKAVRARGEVVMVGVPWKKNCDLSAFELLHVIFHRYVQLRSGWEWEVPRNRPKFGTGSLMENYAAALEWLASGKVNVDGLFDVARPSECQQVYGGLLARTRPSMATIFDWSEIA